MSKIKISFVQYGGFTYRTLVRVAEALDKNIFKVNYFWCMPGIDRFSNFKHPKPTPQEIKANIEKLESNGVNVYEFEVDSRYIPDPNLPWINTNFFEIFNKVKTDIVFCWRSGRQEFPFCHLKVPIIEWNVFGQYDPSINTIKSLAISPFCREEYIRNGGNKENSEIVYLPVKKTISDENFRNELGLTKNTIVLGMHQRKEDTIFSDVSLRAIDYVSKNSNKEIFTLFLGGSDLYKKLANNLKINSFFIESTQDYKVVSKFLNTLDIYTHARKDGETLGAVLQEAMMHKLPVISHKSQWNAHIDTIGPGGIVTNNQKHYNETLLNWINNIEASKEIGLKGYTYANERYSFDQIINQIESSFISVFNVYKTKKFQPLSLNIYRKRRIIYFIRYYLIVISTYILIKIFGQKGTQLIPKLKQIIIKIRS